jgi:hypothetical protein
MCDHGAGVGQSRLLLAIDAYIGISQKTEENKI